MKRFSALLLAAVILLCLVLTGCGGSTKVVNSKYHLQVSFPSYMSVFIPGQTAKDDPAFDGKDFDYDALQEFAENDGVFYALGEKDGISREFSVTVTESEYATQLWQLSEKDPQTAADFQQDMIDDFNASGYAVRQKGEFTQGRVYCLFLTIEEGQGDGYDTIYMFTIYNGLHYAVLYRSSKDISETQKEECFDLFDSFVITETLENPNEEPEDHTVARAVLILVLILILCAAVVVVVRMIRSHRTPREEKPYVSQFDDLLNTPDRKDKR